MRFLQDLEISQKEASGGGRVERKKEETKGKIINVALQLFKEQGFDATTMGKTAGTVDIAKGTLYNYFPVSLYNGGVVYVLSYTRRTAGYQGILYQTFH